MLCLILIFFLLDPKGSKNEATHKKGTFPFPVSFSLFSTFYFCSSLTTVCDRLSLMQRRGIFQMLTPLGTWRKCFLVKLWRCFAGGFIRKCLEITKKTAFQYIWNILGVHFWPDRCFSFSVSHDCLQTVVSGNRKPFISPWHRQM